MKKRIIEEKISEKEEKNLIKKSLKYSTKDGISSTIATSIGNNFISPYAVSLNASNFQIGLLSAIPYIIPTELFTSSAMEKFSRKNIVTLGVLIQAILWPMIALLGIFSLKSHSFAMIAPTLLIVLYSALIGFELFIGPAWSSWMKNLTENVKLGRYFGLRNKIFGIISLISIIAAGFVLKFFEEKSYVFFGFLLLFLTASLARLVSRGYLKKQYEPEFRLKEKYVFSLWQFIKKAPTNNFGRFAIFLGFVNFAQMIAGPFFTPYMLKELKMNYVTFTFINLIVSSTATFLVMPLWGKFLDKYGCVQIMRTTAISCSLIPVLWMISASTPWLVIAQIISGVSWAGFNLAAGTFAYHSVTKERIGICVAYSSIFNGVGIFLGSLLGGFITSLHVTFMSVFFLVFLVSSVARLIVMTVLLPKVQEVKKVKAPYSLFKIILKPLKGINHVLFGNIIGEIYPFTRFKHRIYKNGFH